MSRPAHARRACGGTCGVGPDSTADWHRGDLLCSRQARESGDAQACVFAHRARGRTCLLCTLACWPAARARVTRARERARLVTCAGRRCWVDVCVISQRRSGTTSTSVIWSETPPNLTLVAANNRGSLPLLLSMFALLNLPKGTLGLCSHHTANQILEYSLAIVEAQTKQTQCASSTSVFESLVEQNRGSAG